MSCAEQENTRVRRWTWCRKWGIPYPCRRTVTEVWFRYDFSQTRYVPSWFPFWVKREGCCNNVLHGWRYRVWWNSPKPYGWSYIPESKSFRNRLDPKGACPPRSPGDSVVVG